MKNIPVVVNEDKWTTRCPNGIVEQQVVADEKRLLPKLVKVRRKVDEVQIKSSPILSTKRTRSGRVVVPKKYNDEIVGDLLLEDVDKDLSNGDRANVENLEVDTNTNSDLKVIQNYENIGKLFDT